MAPRKNGTDQANEIEDPQYTGLTGEELLRETIENPDEEDLSPEMLAVVRGAAEEVGDLNIE